MDDSENTDNPGIFILPDELLITVFKFCDLQSLGRLSCTCRKLQRLIRYEKGLWIEKSRFLLGSNMQLPEMRKRCKPFLTPRLRCRYARSWEFVFGEKKVPFTFQSCMSWHQLEANYLYCSSGKRLSKFYRTANGNILRHKRVDFQPKNVDITRFVVNDNELILAFADGTIGRWDKHNLQCIDSILGHDDIVLGIDAKDNIIVSGGRDWTIQVWKMTGYKIDLMYSKYMNVRVLSTAVIPSFSHFIAGFPGVNYTHPLQLFDLERGKRVTNFGETYLYGAGVLDIYPETCDTFLSCGYDTTVKLWDIRTPKSCVMEWMDPYDNTINCVSSDNHITVVSGANRHGIVHVWDKRRPTLSQFMCQLYSEESPVYSISFDATHIFASLERGLFQFSFNFE